MLNELSELIVIRVARSDREEAPLRKIGRRGPFWFACVIVLFLVSLLCAYAQVLESEFEAEGTTKEFEVDPMTSAERYVRESKFLFSVKGCVWFSALATSLDNFTQISESACDGKDVFALCPFIRSGREAHVKSGTMVIKHSGTVMPGPIPYYGDQGAFVWLTYGSMCVLRGQPDTLRPVFLGYQAKQVAPIKVILNEQSPGLPIEVAFISKTLAKRDFTNWLFQTTSFTNFCGLALPAAFNARLFREDGKMRLRYEGRLLHLSGPPTRVRMQPDMPGMSVVTDRRLDARFGLDAGFSYVTNRWLTVEEAAKRPELLRNLPPRTSPFIKPIIILVLLVSATVFFAKLLFAKLRTTLEQQ
jgi:hypothetical protein